MLIEDWPLTKIRPYPNNPRVLRNAAEKVAESIKAFGWRQPIVVDAEGVIIVGHSRLAAAQLLKLKKAPVHVAVDLTPDQVRALRIADNKTGTYSGWDDAKLADELAEIMAGLGNVSVTGFSQSEFDALEMQARAEVERFTAPAPQAGATDSPATPVPASAGDEDDFNLGDDDGETGQPETGMPATAGTAAAQPDLVPFNVLLQVDDRQTVYDAIAAAKQRHTLKTTAEALVVIARAYDHA